MHLHVEVFCLNSGKNRERGAATKTILGLALVLVLSTALWAQGDQPSCAFCITVCDKIYNPGNCGQPDSSFVSKTFQVPCDTFYQVSAITQCKNPTNCTCRDFETCVFVYEPGNPIPIASPHTLTCYDGTCIWTFTHVPMQRNIQYTLYVGKVPCGVETCPTCSPDGCSSLGRVYRLPEDVCGTWTCN